MATPAGSDPGQRDQQVMTAQVTTAASQEPEQGRARLEGETMGPDYARPQLPNGVVASSRASGSPRELESLPYSPAVLPQGGREATAFLSEAWPAQPQPEGSNSGDVPTALRWMQRLGEFFRQHPAMETFTTMTRQQFVAPSGSAQAFMMQQQVQHASQPATPHRESHGSAGASSDVNPPLFGRHAKKAMEAWHTQAPLLHGPRATTATDEQSSDSIPRDLVESEVRRQIQEALRAQQQGLDDLREENRRLRQQVKDAHALQGQGTTGDALHPSPGVLEGDRAAMMQIPPEADARASLTSHGVLGGDRAYSSQGLPADARAPLTSRGVLGGDRAYSHQGLFADARAPLTSPGVLGGDRAYSTLELPADARASLTSPGVLGGDRAYSSQGMSTDARASLTSRGVLGGDRAYVGSAISVLDQVPSKNATARLDDQAPLTSRGVLGGDRVPLGFQEASEAGLRSRVDAAGSSGPAVFEPYVPSDPRGSRTETGGTRLTPGDDHGVGGRAGEGRRGWFDRASRSASPDNRGRVASNSPGRQGRNSSTVVNVRGRFLRRGAGDLLHGLSDGDMYGVRPMEEAYRARPVEAEPTFGEYGGDFPPGLGGTYPEGGRVVPTTSTTTAPVGQPLGGAAPDVPTAPTGTPSPIDVLITGMSQLQQVLLKQKAGDTMDLEAKAVVELSKLPEYTPESGATDFQDYLYLTEQQVGSLASGATDWWQRTLQVAQRAYGEYQSLSPMKRLSVKAVLTDDLKEEKYKKLERKVASLLLNSLPRPTEFREFTRFSSS